MKVLVVTTWLPTQERPEVGAFVARDISLLSQEHDVQVLHLSVGGTPFPLSEEVPVTTVPMSPANPVSVRRAARIIAERESSVDLVHTMAVSALLPFVTMRPRRPWVHTEHWSALLAPSTTGLGARAAIPLAARLLARPDLVIAVGERLATTIRRWRRTPTIVIPNGVDRSLTLTERPREPAATLVAVGALIARKGPDIAVRTISELQRRGVTARLEWAGAGPMLEELERLAEQLGVQNLVRFRGRMPPETVAGFLAEGDLFLLPTTMETFGVSIAEALVAGRPVVVGADGEQEAFVAEPDGVLVHEQTPAAYADGVQRALALNADRAVEDIAARSRALFDPALRAAQYADAYALATGDRRAPDTDVVIAVHDARRRIDRAVRSALTSECVARVIVVCHGVDPATIEAAADTNDPRVEFVSFVDEVHSPAGPFNHGLSLATGRFVSILGSDDELTDGAVDSWRRTAARDDADVVIAPLRHAAGGRVPTPPTPRSRRLRGAADRLAYRTAPLGLISRDVLNGLRLTPGLATGEDLAFTLRIWFGSAKISGGRMDGEYLIHDGEDRVTFAQRPLADELRAIELLLGDPWTQALCAKDRIAIAVKLWRITVFGAVHYRAGAWTPADRTWLSDLSQVLREFAPGAVARLSRADAALIAGLADTSVADAEIDAMSTSRRRFGSLSTLVPSRLILLLSREAPMRFMVATWLAGRR